MIIRVQTSQGKFGLCAICAKEGKLCKDHIPPKSVFPASDMWIKSAMSIMTGTKQEKRELLSPNGLPMQTICMNCNSMLGGKYDKTLKDFCNALSFFLRSGLIFNFPRPIQIRTRPARLLRAIIGHLLAAKRDPDFTPLDNQLSQFVRIDKLPLDSNIRVLYWIYPYLSITAIRDISMPLFPGNLKSWGILSILKFLPLGIMVTTDSFCYEHGLPNMGVWGQLGLNDWADIPISRKIFPEHWPEQVGNNGAVLMGASGVNSLYARMRNNELINAFQ